MDEEPAVLPSLFVSHGAPTLALSDVPAAQFLRSLPAKLPRKPRAILVVSAHWETEAPRVSAVDRNEPIHGFTGFQDELYEIGYAPAGSPDLAEQVAGLLKDAGFTDARTKGRGIDHGAWVPLSLMYPAADIPVVQLSVIPSRGITDHVKLGAALSSLSADDVLVMGSGSLTHNFAQFQLNRDAIDAQEPNWVSEFANWIGAVLADGRITDLIAYRRLAPHAERNHLTEEHLLPLFVALGAGGATPIIEHLHASVTYGVLRMDAFSFSQ